MTTIKGDEKTYLLAADIRATGGQWNKVDKTWTISADDLYNNMMYEGRRTVDCFYRFYIVNRADWDRFIAQKKEQARAPAEVEKTDHKTVKIADRGKKKWRIMNAAPAASPYRKACAVNA